MSCFILGLAQLDGARTGTTGYWAQVPAPTIVSPHIHSDTYMSALFMHHILIRTVLIVIQRQIMILSHVYNFVRTFHIVLPS